ncbi:glutamate-5-semialdehyde dehydrogenase [Blautia liquoris]|uniref:Gamma-glutamyl phosphate reductase n=1 Tax=Blautia liquoris TaxID=2779518 RepID=A0A7M2RKS6_9FIRM|nr:glutamate-5-semialdehyde dehydrogenase [Blautia liquoris]QOV20661.1 glutamate-5-semialdehyde dehydrogenase [Blautia liquoris]
MNLNEIGINAKNSEYLISRLTAAKKNEVLTACANALLEGKNRILAANECDMKHATSLPLPIQDRLLLTSERLCAMADGLTQIAKLPDPIGEVLGMETRPNGLMIGQKRVPLGVVGMIYEARPNVTTDAFGLCFKTGNVVILKGGSDAICSNKAIVSILRETLQHEGIAQDAVALIEDTSHETTAQFMKMNQYVDVLIPRGGAGLIRSVVENSTIPVIQTGTGNCHVYIDVSADPAMAEDIVVNAKTQRTGVCNACESLVIHESMLEKVLPDLSKRLDGLHVEMRADEKALPYVKNGIPAEEKDWGTEYLDSIISIKTVKDIGEAIAHINKYNTKHSESIVTSNYFHAQQFLDEIDASVVYVNASTRFTDGNEFGFGAEIGISTQKLHARGPMGLKALTTTKYIVYGNGQIRP